MRTYLETFMVQTAAEARLYLREECGWSKHRAKAASDFDLMRDFCEKGARLLPVTSGLPDGESNSMANCCAMLATIAPFFRKGTDQPGDIFCRPHNAVRPTVGLVEDLANARPPKSSKNLVDDALGKAVWYIDMPHRAIMVTENQELRAICTSPFLTRDGEIGISAVTTRPGTDILMSRMTWIFGMADAWVGIPCGVDSDHLIESVEAVLSLVVLCDLLSEDNKRPAAPNPRRNANQPRPRWVKGRHNRQPTKPFQLFQLRHLDSPTDHFERPRSTVTRGGWQLHRRTAVKGHLKMQRCGPGGLQRKLIWVDAHERGPRDAPSSNQMTVLGPNPTTHPDQDTPAN